MGKSRVPAQDVVAFARTTSVRTEMRGYLGRCRRDSHAGSVGSVVSIACTSHHALMLIGPRSPGQRGRQSAGQLFAGVNDSARGVRKNNEVLRLPETLDRRLIHLLLDMPPRFWAAFFFGVPVGQ